MNELNWLAGHDIAKHNLFFGTQVKHKGERVCLYGSIDITFTVVITHNLSHARKMITLVNVMSPSAG